MPALRLFLSFNTAGRTSVIAVRKLIEAHGIATYLDREKLVADLPRPQALEQGLKDVRPSRFSRAATLPDGRSPRRGPRWIGRASKDVQGGALPAIPEMFQRAKNDLQGIHFLQSRR